jgi:hypothetical protein
MTRRLYPHTQATSRQGASCRHSNSIVQAINDFANKPNPPSLKNTKQQAIPPMRFKNKNCCPTISGVNTFKSQIITLPIMNLYPVESWVNTIREIATQANTLSIINCTQNSTQLCKIDIIVKSLYST